MRNDTKDLTKLQNSWDSDLIYAMECHNIQLSSKPVEIELELTGQNDGAEWHWIVRLASGTYAYVHGGCDYTGWDCQSSCEAHEATALDGALALVPESERATFQEMRANGEWCRESKTNW